MTHAPRFVSVEAAKAVKRIVPRILLVGVAIVTPLILGVACSEPRPPAATISRWEIIRKASEQATQPAPEFAIQQAQIAEVTAELTTLGDADQRQGLRNPSGSNPDRDLQTPIWLVTVRGSFTYTGMPAPGLTPVAYQATGRVFVYDARTGDLVNASVRDSQPLTPAPAP